MILFVAILFIYIYYFIYITFLVLFSLCARLNGQLGCRFSSANHLSYHIISYSHCKLNLIG